MLTYKQDIQEKNIMLSIEDKSILVDFEEAEISNPSPRKVVGDRAIYQSRKLGLPKKHGRPVLSDFGEARFGSESGTYYDDVQPFMYRAPEVLLRMSWNEKIDIWNLAVLVCLSILHIYFFSKYSLCRPGTYSSKAIFFTPGMQINRNRIVTISLK